MTNHYTTPKIEAIFDDQTTLIMWHTLEAGHLISQAALGLIPREWVEEIRRTPPPSVDAWEMAKQVTHHEVTAYLHATGLDHIHIGLTSSDLTDTALAMKIALANEQIDEASDKVLVVLDELIEQHKTTPYLARTHGQPAVPDHYGRRLSVLRDQIDRCSGMHVVPGKLSGPVGSFVTRAVHPVMEYELLRSLDLVCPCDDPSHQPKASQIVARDFLARWAWGAAHLVSAYAALALDIRLLAHSGVNEVREGRGPGYTGSSAMPHKRNPNRCERMTGLARMARAAAFAISEGIEQWHERDLAHSSVEREFVPMLAGLAAYSGDLMFEILDSLEVDVERMWTNLQQHYTEAFTHERMVDLQLDGVPYQQAAKMAVITEEDA